MKRVAVTLWVLVVVLVAAGTIISLGRDVMSDVVLYAVLPLNLATVGALILSTDVENRIGWTFGLLGLYIAVAEVAQGYGLLAADESLPGGELGTWVISWSWMGEMATWTVIAALFPDGRLAGARWRWVPWCAGAGFLLGATGMALGPESNASFASGANPLRVDHPAVDAAFFFGLALLFVALLGAAGSLVVRMRRARGVERQQLKWFAFAIGVVALVAPPAVLLWTVTPVAAWLIAVAGNAIPVAAGIAILRYRLYDIDLVIKRTLIYALLTFTLVMVYLGSVLLLQAALSPLAGESELAVAASTLAVAALFGPLRTRIQRLVDRRFYRARYDAGQTLEAFSGRLRHELDLDQLAVDLRAVVHDTMRPAHVSLWLRGAP